MSAPAEAAYLRLSWCAGMAAALRLFHRPGTRKQSSARCQNRRYKAAWADLFRSARSANAAGGIATVTSQSPRGKGLPILVFWSLCWLANKSAPAALPICNGSQAAQGPDHVGHRNNQAP